MDASDTTFYIDAVLGAIVQPLLHGCRTAAQALGPVDMATFVLNNVAAIKVSSEDDFYSLLIVVDGCVAS